MYKNIKPGYTVEVVTPRNAYRFVCVDPERALFRCERNGTLDEEVEGTLGYYKGKQGGRDVVVLAGIRDEARARFQFNGDGVKKNLYVGVQKLNLYDENGVNVRELARGPARGGRAKDAPTIDLSIADKSDPAAGILSDDELSRLIAGAETDEDKDI